MRSLIKRILKENESRYSRYIEMIRNFIFDEMEKKGYGRGMGVNVKPDTRAFHVYDNLHSELEKKFGFAWREENNVKLFRQIFDEWFSEYTGLPKIGDRIRLIKMHDQWTNLKEGDLGTVKGFNPTPWEYQLKVEWDNGSNLDIIPSEDKYEVLS